MFKNNKTYIGSTGNLQGPDWIETGLDILI